MAVYGGSLTDLPLCIVTEGVILMYSYFSWLRKASNYHCKGLIGSGCGVTVVEFHCLLLAVY